MNEKRLFLVVMVFVVTIICLTIMNRNYDPLARYHYEISDETRELLLTKLDERELKYIVDYEIEPSYYLPYINNGLFNAYHVEDYKIANDFFVHLNDNEVVYIVESIYKAGLDLKQMANDYANYKYEEILFLINNK